MSELRKREISRFAVIDVSNGAIGNVYYELHEVAEECENADAEWTQFGGATKRNVPATVDDVAAFVGANNAKLAQANATLNAQNTAQGQEIASLRAALRQAEAALAAVAAKDAEWDHSPRVAVGGALDAIAALNLPPS